MTERPLDPTDPGIFGLGRLQPLVDDGTVENVIFHGGDNVWIQKTDGTLIKVDPVTDSDQEPPS